MKKHDVRKLKRVATRLADALADALEELRLDYPEDIKETGIEKTAHKAFRAAAKFGVKPVGYHAHEREKT
jgi:hypothetical protein